MTRNIPAQVLKRTLAAARQGQLGTGHHPRPDQRAVQKLLKEFGSTELVRAASEGQLAMVFGRAAAKKVRAHYVAEAPQV